MKHFILFFLLLFTSATYAVHVATGLKTETVLEVLNDAVKKLSDKKMITSDYDWYNAHLTDWLSYTYLELDTNIKRRWFVRVRHLLTEMRANYRLRANLGARKLTKTKEFTAAEEDFPVLLGELKKLVSTPEYLSKSEQGKMNALQQAKRAEIRKLEQMQREEARKKRLQDRAKNQKDED